MGGTIRIPEEYSNSRPLQGSGYTTEMNWCVKNEQALIDEPLCNEIVDQGNCTKSGGAFATIAAIETMYMYQSKNLVKLSEQNCLDCAYTENEGCATAYEPTQCLDLAYTQQISLNSTYPYEGKNETCKNKGAGPTKI